MPRPRAHCTYTAANEKLYIFGGLGEVEPDSGALQTEYNTDDYVRCIWELDITNTRRHWDIKLPELPEFEKSADFAAKFEARFPEESGFPIPHGYNYRHCPAMTKNGGSFFIILGSTYFEEYRYWSYELSSRSWTNLVNKTSLSHWFPVSSLFSIDEDKFLMVMNSTTCSLPVPRKNAAGGFDVARPYNLTTQGKYLAVITKSSSELECKEINVNLTSDNSENTLISLLDGTSQICDDQAIHVTDSKQIIFFGGRLKKVGLWKRFIVASNSVSSIF